jgi:hypothetical protein
MVAPGAAPVEGAAGQQAAPSGNRPGSATAGGASSSAPPGMAAMLREACAQSVRGFERAYTLTLYMATLALILGAMLPGWPGPWAGRTSKAHPPEPVGAD